MNKSINTFKNRVLNFLFKDAGIVLLILIAFYCLRSESVGTDISVYKDYYNAFADGSASFSNPYYKYEVGFALINFVFANIGFPFHFIIVVAAIFFLVSFWFLQKKMRIDGYLSFLIFICLGPFDFSLSGLRQTMALAFIMLGLMFLLDKKFLTYFIFVAAACLFHSSAFIALLFIAFYFIPFKTKNVLIVLIFAIICALLSDQIFYLIKLITNVDFVEKYKKVILENNIFRWIWCIANMILVSIALFYKERLNFNTEEKKRNEILLWLIIFAVLIRLVSLIGQVDILQRFVHYGYFSICFVIPIYMYKYFEYKPKKQNYKVVFYACIVLINAIYFILKLTYNDSCFITPYVTIFG